MTIKCRHHLLVAAIVGAIAVMTIHAQEQSIGYTTGEIDTRVGRLTFELGLPTEKTVGNLFDEMDFQRACQAYLWALPIVSISEWQRAHGKEFGAGDGDIVIYDSIADKVGIYTLNGTTPYIIGFANLSRTGPLVIDYPAGCRRRPRFLATTCL